MKKPLTHCQLEAARLILSGYAVTSLSGNQCHRIDREDWKSVTTDADTYRRVYSQDGVICSKGVLNHMPNSNHYKVGFLPLVQKIP